MAEAAQQLAAILQAVQQAATAATDAATAMRESKDRAAQRKSGFSEASKVVKCPESFGGAQSSDDAGKWLDFSFSFKQWLFYADDTYDTDIKEVEANATATRPVTFQATAAGTEAKERSKKLYAILSGILQNRPLKILRQVEEANGYEVWRQLYELYSPKTKTRSLAILSAIMGHPAFTGQRTLLEQIQGLERMADEYRKSSGTDCGDDLMLTTLVRCLPKQIQQHIQLNMQDTSTFREIKEKVVAYERVSSSWSKDRVYAELGAVTSYADAGAQGPGAMDINQVKGKDGKGKGKSKDAKGKHKGKAKGKGKGGKDGKGKGYGSSKGDGKGKGGGKKVEANQCGYCYGYGHWKKDCRKFQADKASGQVRQVDQADNHSDTSSTAQSSNTTTTKATTGKVNRLEMVVEDLTQFNIEDGYVNMLRETYIDFNVDTDLTLEEQTLEGAIGHVRTVEVFDLDEADSEEIILDSGADTSALPLRFAGVGEEQAGDRAQSFVDAQGNGLRIKETTVATVGLTNSLTGEEDVFFKEKFIVTNVNCPLLALGHVMRAGWELRQGQRGLMLVKGEKEVEVLYRRNSLCVRGSIFMVAEEMSPSTSEAPASPSGSPVSTPGEVRAIELRRSLRNLVPGWNRINPQLFAITTKRSKFVDTTMAPSDELMWLRTTLIFQGGTWQVIEYCEPISEMENLEDDIFDPGNNIIEVLTLAHVHALPAEDLGFDWPEETMRPLDLQPQQPAEAHDDDYEQSVRGDDEPHPGAVPVDEKEGEVAEEDRIVPYQDENAVYLDGAKLTIEDSLKNLRLGCESFGLSKRGSKEQCLKRMIEHVRKQELFAAHEAAIKVGSSLQRKPQEQRRPEEPSEQEVKTHNLTHEPYKEWCKHCVAHRARQDAHKPLRSHEVGHSVMSFDFGYASRKEGDKDKVTFLTVADRDTGLVAAIPTLQKGGRFLRYLTTEFVRFIVSTGHRELGLRYDCEPSCLSLSEAVKKACRGVGILVHLEPTPVGDHQANGAAETMVNILRAKANLMVQQVEEESGAKDGQVIFGCDHPLYGWALVHSAWLHNRFVVSQRLDQRTPYEMATGRYYSGKVCQFGEIVLAYLKSSRKGEAKWKRGTWLSKTMQNDVHIVATAEGIFVSRSIRRLPAEIDLEFLGRITSAPWDHGYAALGHRLL